ncbi:3-phytase [Aurantiacibacter atlanticus]|uniref:3-phytase n=1 Tax=Aurantiacibacter atlanticus TaxID=1648404 RepID=A0A0H4VW87_9SPHN|nr:phytase [Aurantiacibacter atlanticus]AKQ41313.1 3-phytase [Aurantiacibacter atlanticus]
MRIGSHTPVALVAAILLSSCATMPATGDPAVAVYASAETVPVGTANEDAADDPAIWRNATSPADSLVVATDKKGGLYVYDLSGQVAHFLARPALNNVDLVDMGDDGVIVFASDRSDLDNAKIALFLLDTSTASLTELATLPSGQGEAYGICGYEEDGSLIIYTAPKEGNIGEWRISLSGPPSIEALRSMRVPSQPEGCVVDKRDGTLYIGEEAGGIWRFASGVIEGELVAAVDNRSLVADLEGLALVPEGDAGGWLYASSQGDNSYMRYALPDMEPAGRFRIAAGLYGSTEETDGIEAMRGDFGPGFPGGLFIAQDGQNGSDAQNFKFVPLGEIEKALSGTIAR